MLTCTYKIIQEDRCSCKKGDATFPFPSSRRTLLIPIFGIGTKYSMFTSRDRNRKQFGPKPAVCNYSCVPIPSRGIPVEIPRGKGNPIPVHVSRLHTPNCQYASGGRTRSPVRPQPETATDDGRTDGRTRGRIRRDEWRRVLGSATRRPTQLLHPRRSDPQGLFTAARRRPAATCIIHTTMALTSLLCKSPSRCATS